MAAKIFSLNIDIYEIFNNRTYYTPYALFKPDSNTEEYILINFENRSHYNLLKLKVKKIMKLIMNQIQKIYIDSNKFKIKLDNKPIKNDIYYENTENKKKQANILK